MGHFPRVVTRARFDRDSFFASHCPRTAGHRLFFADGGDTLADDDAKRETRRAVRGLLNRAATYAAVPGFNNVTAGGKSPFAGAAMAVLQAAGGLVAAVEVLEPRS